MAQKILGYVNLIWTCAYCNTQNPGAIKSCTSCGAPQPPNVQFEKVDDERFDFIKDEALIRMAQAGPDKHCPYCGTRNLADAERCVQCGSDITVGAHVRTSGEKIEERPKEAEVEAPSQPKKMSKGAIIVFALIAIIFCVFSIIFISNLMSRETVSATVTSSNWERSIEILAFTTIERRGWVDEIPGNADIKSCSSEYRYSSDAPVANATEVCGEPYTIDTGTGVGKVVQDCEYRVYDDYCTYAVDDWVVADTITLSGYDLNPRWPAWSLESNEQFGNQSETYTIFFNADGQQYSMTTSDLDLYLQAAPGSSWELEINGLGAIVDVNPD